MKKTLISHIYNERYLLPFWLIHHDKMFDDIIIIDYNSTDNSVNICKSIIPRCKIIQSRNEYFDSKKVDEEVMDIESGIDGIKVVLNTTEYLFSTKPLEQILYKENMCIGMKINEIYCGKNNMDVNSYKDFIKGLLSKDVKYRVNGVRFGYRIIHSYINGNYHLGRHYTDNHIDNLDSKDIFIIWCGYYPLNNKLIDRKLQIKNRIPMSDYVRGFGSQHFIEEEEMYRINNENYNIGINLDNVSEILYKLINDINK